MARFFIVKGRVLDGSNTPVFDASVSIVEASESIPDIASITDEKGTFSFEDIPIGRYKFVANMDDLTGAATVRIGPNAARDEPYIEIVIA